MSVCKQPAKPRWSPKSPMVNCMCVCMRRQIDWTFSRYLEISRRLPNSATCRPSSVAYKLTQWVEDVLVDGANDVEEGEYEHCDPRAVCGNLCT